MGNTERIVIGLLIAVAAGLLYWSRPALWPPPPPAPPERELVEAKALTARLTQEVNKEALSDRDRHLLERAEADWRRNPFEAPRSAARRQTTGTEPASPLSAYTYSGYMEVDKKRLAIISGMQYQVGDRLAYGKYVVRSIEPTKVVVEDIGKREQLTLPFVGGGF